MQSSLYGDMPTPLLRMERLQWAWDRLVQFATPPYPQTVPVEDIDPVLAKASGVDIYIISKVRWVRNQCCHPLKRGWPTQSDIDAAIRDADDIWLRMSAPSSNSNQGGSKKKPADNDPFFQNFDWSGFRFPNEQTETTTVDDRDETTVITLAKEYGMPIDAVFDWFEIHLRMTIPSPSQQINEDRAQKFRDYHQTRRE
ncbi:MAG: hypothetical protein ACRDPD_32055 [Streptosporangiaceae bacterium]